MQQCSWCSSMLLTWSVKPFAHHSFSESFPDSPVPLLSKSKIQTSITTTFPKPLLMLSSLVLIFSFYALTFLIFTVSLLQDNFCLYFRIQLTYHFLHEAFPHFLISSQSLCAYFWHSKHQNNSLGFRIFMDMYNRHHHQFQPYCSP